MKRKLIAVLAILLISTNCFAQSTLPLFDNFPSATEIYGSDDLGRAMSICSKHQIIVSEYTTLPPSPKFDYPGNWGACYAVRSKWETSEAGRKQREKEDQEKADWAFVEKMAK